MKKLCLIILLVCQISNAGDKIEPDKLTHFGVSYAATTFMYGFNKKVFHMDKLPAYIFAASLVNLVGVAKEYTDPKIDGGDIIANHAGSLFFGVTCVMFDF